MSQQLQRFRGDTLDEAYQKMRQALGDQAIVLRTTSVSEGGILGIFGRKKIELTASAPAPKTPNTIRPLTPVEKKYTSTSPPALDTVKDDRVAYFEKLVGDAQKRMTRQSQPSPRRAAIGQAATAPILPFKKPQPQKKETDVIRQDIQELREMLQVLMSESPTAGLPGEFVAHYRTLLETGVSRKIAASLIADVIEGSDAAILRDHRIFSERLKMQLRRRAKIHGGITLTPGTRKIVALVGPTGVGKTTTLAKLASHFAMRERGRVALVTADTYRIAAVEQLRVYANIIGLELLVVNDAKEMAAARKTLKDYDLVLMDTAGGSQFNLQQIGELKKVLRAAQPDEVMLVLSANTAVEDLRHIVSNFVIRFLAMGEKWNTSLLFTKLDETRRYGPLFTILCEAGLPLSYFGIGQNVPDDIVLAHPGMIASLVLEGRDKRGRSSTKTS